MIYTVLCSRMLRHDKSMHSSSDMFKTALFTVQIFVPRRVSGSPRRMGGRRATLSLPNPSTCTLIRFYKLMLRESFIRA